MKREGTGFTCGLCQKFFTWSDPKVWNEEDAMREFETNHPEMIGDKLARVCDACSIKVNDWLKTLTPEQKHEMREKMRQKYNLEKRNDTC